MGLGSTMVEIKTLEAKRETLVIELKSLAWDVDLGARLGYLMSKTQSPNPNP